LKTGLSIYGFQTYISWSNPALKSKICSLLNVIDTTPIVCSVYTLFYSPVIVSHRITFLSNEQDAKYYSFGSINNSVTISLCPKLSFNMVDWKFPNSSPPPLGDDKLIGVASVLLVPWLVFYCKLDFIKADLFDIIDWTSVLVPKNPTGFDYRGILINFFYLTYLKFQTLIIPSLYPEYSIWWTSSQAIQYYGYLPFKIFMSPSWASSFIMGFTGAN